jgi:hypothetical protein
MTTTLERTEAKVIDRGLRPVRNDDGRWARWCATGGAGVWAGLAVLARLGVAHFGGLELLFLFAPLVIVPLGLELGCMMGFDGRLVRIAGIVQPLSAAGVVAAMWVGPGRWAGALACGWLVVCLLVAGAGVGDLFSNSWSQGRVVGVAVGIARVDLAVGGMWLVASRLGMRPMGIQEPIGLLTAVHFHCAGFATAMIAAATLRFAESRGGARWLPALVVFVIGMPYVVATGFVVSGTLKMAAAVLFSIGVAGLAIFARSLGRRAENRAARVCLQVGAASVFAGMVLAGIYAVADFTGSNMLTIPQMARTHGVLNAVGFCMAGLLGWAIEYSAATAAANGCFTAEGAEKFLNHRGH